MLALEFSLCCEACLLAKLSWKEAKTDVHLYVLLRSSVMRPRPFVAHRALTLPLGVMIPKPPSQEFLLHCNLR